MRSLKKNSARIILQLWTPVFVWAGAIFLFSSLPTKPVSEIHWEDFVIKKTAHIVEYAVLTILVYRALKESGLDKKRSGLFSVFISSLYGLTDELHQSFTPGRDPKLRDIIFDTIGAILAIYFLWKLLPKMPERLKALAKNLQLL